MQLACSDSVARLLRGKGWCHVKMHLCCGMRPGVEPAGPPGKHGANFKGLSNMYVKQQYMRKHIYCCGLVYMISSGRTLAWVGGCLAARAVWLHVCSLFRDLPAAAAHDAQTHLREPRWCELDV
jgi:hypothetical protein